MACMLQPIGASAQQNSLTGDRPGGAARDAYLDRQLRSLERRDSSSPESSAMELRRTQRDLITQSRGVLTPDEAQIQRELDRVGRELQSGRLPAEAGQPPALPRGERLPGSVDDPTALPEP